jgi:hypothetical protein
MKFDAKFIIHTWFCFNIDIILSSINLAPEQNMNFHMLGMAACYWFNAAKMPLRIRLYSQTRKSDKTVRLLTPHHVILLILCIHILLVNVKT